MELNNYGFIMLAAGFEPAQSSVLESSKFKMTVWAVADMDAATVAAKSLVAEGVQLIELCGAFKGDMVTDLIAAIESAVPVGNMAYADDQRSKLMAFLSA